MQDIDELALATGRLLQPERHSMARVLNFPKKGMPWLLLAIVMIFSGCATAKPNCVLPDGTAPRELNKASAPEYVISPPDVILIDAVRLVPKPPYKIAPLDALLLQVTVFGGPKEDEKQLPALIPGQPIAGIYRVEPDGVVSLGFTYGSVFVSGQSIPEAKESITKYLQKRFKTDFEVSVNLAESKAMQMIRGEHLVRPDGQVTLGSYGSVYISGMTLEQAKAAIQAHLSKKLLEPEISIDIAGFNSMVFYVIFDQDGSQAISRLPFTGTETVLDAIGELRGLPPGSDRMRIWVARPTQPEEGCDQILPVDWPAITRRGATATNYQLLPGDRVFVSVDPLIAVDGFLGRVISPIQRIFGFALLGQGTVQGFHTSGSSSNSTTGQ
jgi:polysaccharide biosynthesis/export protein